MAFDADALLPNGGLGPFPASPAIGPNVMMALIYTLPCVAFSSFGDFDIPTGPRLLLPFALSCRHCPHQPGARG